MPEKSQRRRHVRIEIGQMIELRYGQEQMIPADGIDLSSKGLLCASDVPVEPHSRIFLTGTSKNPSRV